METIRSYIETMFKGVEATKEIQDLKEEISSNMQERYRELKTQGKSENEAIGTVISEFGNIDELLVEMGYQAENAQKNEERVPMAKREEVIQYLQDAKAQGKSIGIGVGIIMYCVAFYVLGDAIAKFLGLTSSIDTMLTAILIMGVGVAVAIFVYTALKMEEKYEHIVSGEMRIDSATMRLVEEEMKNKKSKQNIQLVIGVVLCIIAVIPVIVGEFVAQDLGEDIGTAILLFVVAIAVYLFISTGVERSAYQELLKKNEIQGDEKYMDEDYDFTEAESTQAAKWIGRIEAIMWSITTGIYLYLGFVRDLWHPGWVVFVIASLLSPVIAVVVNILTEHKK